MLQGDTKRAVEFDSIKIVYLDKVTEQSILNLTAVTILTHQDLFSLAWGTCLGPVYDDSTHNKKNNLCIYKLKGWLILIISFIGK